VDEARAAFKWHDPGDFSGSLSGTLDISRFKAQAATGSPRMLLLPASSAAGTP
jgi:hypothetical protein